MKIKLLVLTLISSLGMTYTTVAAEDKEKTNALKALRMKAAEEKSKGPSSSPVNPNASQSLVVDEIDTSVPKKDEGKSTSDPVITDALVGRSDDTSTEAKKKDEGTGCVLQ